MVSRLLVVLEEAKTEPLFVGTALSGPITATLHLYYSLDIIFTGALATGNVLISLTQEFGLVTQRGEFKPKQQPCRLRLSTQVGCPGSA